MMKTLNWLMKYVALPSTPFILGAFVRAVHSGTLRLNWFSASELSFSMAMLSLVLAVNAAKITNQDLRQALISICQFGVMIALAIFAWSIFLEADIQSSLWGAWQTLRDATTNGKVIAQNQLPPRVEEFETILTRLRIASFILAFITISFAVVANKKYGLEDL